MDTVYQYVYILNSGFFLLKPIALRTAKLLEYLAVLSALGINSKDKFGCLGLFSCSSDAVTSHFLIYDIKSVLF